MTARLRLDQPLLVLTAGVGVALLSGMLIGRGQWMLPVGLGLLGLVALIALHGGRLPAVLVVVATLIQIPIGGIGQIGEVRALEVLVPILLLSLVVGTAIGAGAATAAERPRARGAVLALNVAVACYAGVLALNYVRSKYVLETPASVGRPYWAYFVALGVYALVFTTLAWRRIGFHAVLRLLFWLSAAMCLLGLVAVALKLPLNLGGFEYSVTTYTESNAVRAGFLGTFGSIGLALVAANTAPARLLSGTLFVAALVVSGGRSTAIGIALGVVLYLLVSRRWLALGGVAVSAIVAIGLVLPVVGDNGQVRRLTDVSSQAFESNARAFYYEESIREFKAQPVTGTGIGKPSAVYSRNPRLAEFQEQQLLFGGHATYHSLLKNLGLLGFIPFIAALLVGLVAFARHSRSSPAAAVAFMVTISFVVVMIAGGNGSDPVYFLFLALGAAALTLRGAGTRRGTRPQEP